jgi:hypothetical protein
MHILKIFLLVIFFEVITCTHGYRVVAKSSGVLKNPGVADCAGVRIIAEVEQVTKKSILYNKLTPLRITVKNNTGKSLYVKYCEFSLTGEETGRNYPAFPLYELTGEPENLQVILPYPFPIDLLLIYDRFFVAPYCSRMYPSMPSSSQNFPVDTLYYSRNYTMWAELQLPAEQLLRELIPDGILGDGGHISGLLYFPKIHFKDKAFVFKAELINAEDDKSIGIIEIPFHFIKE